MALLLNRLKAYLIVEPSLAVAYAFVVWSELTMNIRCRESPLQATQPGILFGNSARCIQFNVWALQRAGVATSSIDAMA
jgi:hypothetical protein